jgi:hypothetical protein
MKCQDAMPVRRRFVLENYLKNLAAPNARLKGFGVVRGVRASPKNINAMPAGMKADKK